MSLTVDRLADEGRFRQDLLFRLNTIEIELPPLRDRREDIPLLLDHYLAGYSRKYGAPDRELGGDVLEALVGYHWPGNVRSLRHAAERAVILAEGRAFRIEDFPLPRDPSPPVLSVIAAPADQDLNLERVERQMVERALQMHHYNISLSAAELGLTRAALYRRMEKYGL